MNGKKVNIWPVILLFAVIVVAISVLSNTGRSDNYSYSAFINDLNSAESTITSAVIEQNAEVPTDDVSIYLPRTALSVYLQYLMLMMWQTD